MSRSGKVDRELPFAGSIGGSAIITGSLRKPETLVAEFRAAEIEMKANPKRPLRAGGRVRTWCCETQPGEVHRDLEAVTSNARTFAATDTSLEAAGRVTFDAQSPWDVAVKGRMNLAILQPVQLRPDRAKATP